MSPEQCCGERDIDQRADVWALGVILYECLSGKRPVDGENLGQFVTRLLRDEIVPLERLMAGLPSELVRVVGRMLSRDRENRPRDLVEARDALSRVAGLSAELGEIDIDSVAPAQLAAGWLQGPPSTTRQSARWDAGIAHALSALARPLAVPRARAALAALGALGIVGWSIARSAPHRAYKDQKSIEQGPLADIAATERAHDVEAPHAPAPEGTLATGVPATSGVPAASAAVTEALTTTIPAATGRPRARGRRRPLPDQSLDLERDRSRKHAARRPFKAMCPWLRRKAPRSRAPHPSFRGRSRSTEDSSTKYRSELLDMSESSVRVGRALSVLLLVIPAGCRQIIGFEQGFSGTHSPDGGSAAEIDGEAGNSFPSANSPWLFASPECGTCVDRNCTAEARACGADPSCEAFEACVVS